MEAFITSGSLVRLCIFINYVKELCRKLREKASIYTYSGSRFRFFGGRCPLFWPSLGRGGVFWAPRKTTPPPPHGVPLVSFCAPLGAFGHLWAPLGILLGTLWVVALRAVAPKWHHMGTKWSPTGLISSSV